MPEHKAEARISIRVLHEDEKRARVSSVLAVISRMPPAAHVPLRCQTPSAAVPFWTSRARRSIHAEASISRQRGCWAIRDCTWR